MLKRRLIPKLQLGLRSSYRGLRPVLQVTRQFSNKRAIGDPLSQAKIYEAQLADELILLDIERNNTSWPILLSTLESISQSLATPISVGGGVSCYQQVQHLLDRGADKVVLNSGAIEDPSLIDQVASSYGSQCVVLSIDVRETSPGIWRVWSDGGNLDTQRDPLEWTAEAVNRGVGEVMVTSIDRDGTGSGLDLPLLSSLTDLLQVPVIASGGCGLAKHLVQGYEAGASAVSAGTLFSQRDQNPMQLRSQIVNAGFPIRTEV